MPLPRSRAELCAVIDHTMLVPEATAADSGTFLLEALQLGVSHVCVSPSLVPAVQQRMSELPQAQQPQLVAVAGFPSGAHSREVKSAEIEQLLSQSVRAVDVVANLGLITGEDWSAVHAEFLALRAAASDAKLKIILETACLTPQQITRACEIARETGADYVKTSTGFHPSGGASVAAVQLMVAAVGGVLGIKASGGIRSAAFARELLDAGATRLGLSRTSEVLNEWEALFPFQPLEGDS